MASPKACFLEELSVEGLWGEKDLSISFKPDINIIIGPNASGKTTLLNILRFVLTPDPVSLLDLDFSAITVRLRSFIDESRRSITVTKTSDLLSFKVGQRAYPFGLDPDIPRRLMHTAGTKRPPRLELRELIDAIQGVVPAVWLPVSRRLPIPDEDEEELYYGHLMSESRRRGRLESVDHRLRELTGELAKYRLQLDASLAKRYKDFERKVLEIILYNKDHDRIGAPVRATDIPKADEKELLVRSFQEAGLIDARMRQRIDEHFRVAEQVLTRLARDRSTVMIEDIAIMPLIPRTRAMIDAARELEVARESLFAPLRRFESLVSSFFGNKRAEVLNNGELVILVRGTQQRALGPEKLSSGEKQLLILLTQALLRTDEPAVYVADEPELSLHVTWQSKLLSSLVELGGQIQIIVATHSPDIVGPFRNRVIDLARLA